MIDLNLDADLKGLGSISAGLSNRIINLLKKAFQSSTNLFGSAARENSSQTGAGNLVEIGSNGKISSSVISVSASKFTSGTVKENLIPNLSTSKFTGIISSDRLSVPGRTGQYLTKTSTGQEWKTHSQTNIKASLTLPSSAPEGTIIFYVDSTHRLGWSARQFKNNNWIQI